MSWVKGWLKYCAWYYGTALSPDVTLESFFSAPVYIRDWYLKRRDEDLVRFGLLWRIYDLVGEKGLSYRPPILTYGSALKCWILGGASGNDFLVEPCGLIRLGKGLSYS